MNPFFPSVSSKLIVKTGNKYIDSQLSYGGLIPGMTFEIVKDGEFDEEVNAIVGDLLRNSQMKIGTVNTKVYQEMHPTFQTIIISTRKHSTSYVNWEYSGIRVIQLETMKDGRVHQETLEKLEQILCVYRDKFTCVVVDKLEPVSIDLQHPCENVLNVGAWMQLFRNAFQGLDKTILNFVIDKPKTDVCIVEYQDFLNREMGDCFIFEAIINSENPNHWSHRFTGREPFLPFFMD